MGVEYSPAIDMFIDDPAWVFTDALTDVPNQEMTIVLHKTACGSFCSATDVATFFHNDTSGHKSVHFIVGKDGSVIQVVHLKDGAGGNCCLETGHDTYWDRLATAYGNLNRCTISIEHEDWTSDNSDTVTPAQQIASFALVKMLVQKYSLSLSQIKGHNTLDPISRARCPGTYPMQALLTYLAPPNKIEDVALVVWNSFYTGMAETPPGTNTGIYKDWHTAFLAGKNYGPAMSFEYNNPNIPGGKLQNFGYAQASWVAGHTVFTDARGIV